MSCGDLGIRTLKFYLQKKNWSHIIRCSYLNEFNLSNIQCSFLNKRRTSSSQFVSFISNHVFYLSHIVKRIDYLEAENTLTVCPFAGWTNRNATIVPNIVGTALLLPIERQHSGVFSHVFAFNGILEGSSSRFL